MFGRGVFLKGKNFDSIVIVVPLHVSKFYRVLKKLTAYGPAEWIDPARYSKNSIGWLEFSEMCHHAVGIPEDQIIYLKISHRSKLLLPLARQM
jgi:hypothetical protein